jgi:peptidoglycan/xylan/chitin deacetylase (PgdA/CDA1 family)
MYHGVVRQSLEPFCWTQLPEKKFRFQISYLKKNYSVLKLSELIEKMRNGKPLPDYTAVVTFDDGYRNNYTIAYPILSQYHIPAVIFLATRCVSDQVHCWPDRLYLAIKHTSKQGIDLTKWGLPYYSLRLPIEKEMANQEIAEYLKMLPRHEKDLILEEIIDHLKIHSISRDSDFDLMSWDDIKFLSNYGLIEFGSHTATHNILSQMDPSDAVKEIKESCETIEHHCGKSCQFFAYPNGRKIDFTDYVKEQLKKSQVDCALTTIPGLNDRSEDLFELKRVSIGADISPARFKCLVSGLSYHFKNSSLIP